MIQDCSIKIFMEGTSYGMEPHSFLPIYIVRRSFESVSLNQRLLNLAQLFHSLRSGWGEEERLRFIENYFEGEPILLKKGKNSFERFAPDGPSPGGSGRAGRKGV